MKNEIKDTDFAFTILPVYRERLAQNVGITDYEKAPQVGYVCNTMAPEMSEHLQTS